MYCIRAQIARNNIALSKMKRQFCSQTVYDRKFVETSYPFIPAIRDQYENVSNATTVSSNSLTSLVSLITELEMQYGGWSKEKSYIKNYDSMPSNDGEVRLEKILGSNDDDSHTTRNSCRFQRTRKGNYC